MRSSAPLMLAILVMATAARAEVTISGTKSQVTTNPGAQFDPSISGDIVVYTDRRAGNDDIYYTDLATGAEVAVANDPYPQRLHDVSDGRIVYTDFSGAEPQVWVYDVPAATSSAIAPQASSQQLEPSLDGGVVAFEVYAPPFGNADIAVVDLAAGSYAVITATAAHEGRPAVGGTFVVFERGPTPLAPSSQIVLYDLATGSETVLGDGLEPHTDGRRVAWRTGSDAEADIVVVDTLTGGTTTIALPGPQTRARLSGDVLAFDDESLGNPDVVLLHLPSGITHRIDDGGAAEFLNDLDGNRLVYTSTETGNFDIFLFELTLEGLDDDPPPPPPPPPLTEDPCTDVSGLEELYAGEVVREPGPPNELSAAFSALPGDGVVVVENQGCAAAVVTLNGADVFTPADFTPHMQCDFRWLSLTEENELDVEVRSAPGCAVAVTVYAVAPTEDPSPDEPDAPPSDDDDDDDDDTIPPLQTLPGDIGELSCDTSGAESSWSLAALTLAALLVGRRRRR